MKQEKEAAMMKQHQFLLHGSISTDLNNRRNRCVDFSRWAHGRQGNYLSLFLESIGGSLSSGSTVLAKQVSTTPLPNTDR